ncbi:MAG: DNA polymerase Y family protein [Acidimicrobiales bacterium]
MQPVRTLVVWCLDWPVVAIGHGSDVPVAVVHANRVIACSASARAQGVQRGQRRREAQGRCPSVIVAERDEAREARLFESVIAACEAFTPRIEITRPGSCAFATRGPSRYFGGDALLAQQVQARVHAVLAGRTECHIGIADGPFAASIAARAASTPYVVASGGTAAFLEPLSVTMLEQPDITDVMLRLGITTLGQLAALPLRDVVGRFGSLGEWSHRIASGLDDRLPDARRPPPELEVALEFEPPVERIEQVAFAARTLADELHTRLDALGLACSRLAIDVESEHGERVSRLWRHEGALSVGAIADRVRWQLDGWLHAAVATRPTGGLTRLVLAPDEVIPATGRQLGFWGGETEADERAKRALARVHALLGPDAVRVPEWRGGRGPSEQLRLVPAQNVELVDRTVMPPALSRPPWPGQLPLPSPAIVYEHPRDVDVVDDADRPVTVDGRSAISAAPARVGADRVVAWAGPWPADERWWDDARRSRRARVQVVLDGGAAHVLVLHDGRWSIEATYD